MNQQLLAEFIACDENNPSQSHIALQNLFTTVNQQSMIEIINWISEMLCLNNNELFVEFLFDKGIHQHISNLFMSELEEETVVSILTYFMNMTFLKHQYINVMLSISGELLYHIFTTAINEDTPFQIYTLICIIIGNLILDSDDYRQHFIGEGIFNFILDDIQFFADDSNHDEIIVKASDSREGFQEHQNELRNVQFLKNNDDIDNDIDDKNVSNHSFSDLNQRESILTATTIPSVTKNGLPVDIFPKLDLLKTVFKYKFLSNPSVINDFMSIKMWLLNACLSTVPVFDNANIITKQQQYVITDFELIKTSITKITNWLECCDMTNPYFVTIKQNYVHFFKIITSWNNDLTAMVYHDEIIYKLSSLIEEKINPEIIESVS